jgi:adenylate cyclase
MAKLLGERNGVDGHREANMGSGLKWFRINSLQQRMAVLLLFPVALMLFGIGVFGFLYARASLLKQWREASILRLERAAHHVEMRLQRPMELIEMFNQTGQASDGDAIQAWLIERLRGLEGVTSVELKLAEGQTQSNEMGGMGEMMGQGVRRRMGAMMRFHKARISEVTLPHYDARVGRRTVTLQSMLKDENGRLVGTLQVELLFDYLLQDIQRFGWWQSDEVYIVDDEGQVLARATSVNNNRKRLGEEGNILEAAVLKAMKEEPFGTILSPGHPPDVVSGFYRIKSAPWTIVIFAPGESILAPIIRFRTLYFLIGAASILVIIVLIRFVVGRAVRAVTNLSRIAGQVAGGNYGPPLPVSRHDEIGQLTESFNQMVNGLKERDFISNTFGRYVDQEVAKELLSHPEALKLGGEKRPVVVLMSDLRDFTPLSESLPPEETIGLLNRYYSRMIQVVQENRGIIVDFYGDALLAFFDPLGGPLGPCAQRAIRCGLEMQNLLLVLNRESESRGLSRLEMGVGIHCGDVVVGNIGSETRAKYGIVGAPVNMAHRIQSLAQVGQVVASEQVYRVVADQLIVKESFYGELKGFRDPVRLHVLDGMRERGIHQL